MVEIKDRPTTEEAEAERGGNTGNGRGRDKDTEYRRVDRETKGMGEEDGGKESGIRERDRQTETGIQKHREIGGDRARQTNRDR